MGLDLAAVGIEPRLAREPSAMFKVPLTRAKTSPDDMMRSPPALEENHSCLSPAVRLSAVRFRPFPQIANSVGADFMEVMAHIAGLEAGGVHPNPLEHAHVVTTTTHKTLRGPRGGMILSRDEAIGKKINSSVFPGLQGGPLEHVIAAKAVAFGEALRPAFKKYAAQVAANARALADAMIKGGCDLVSRTDTH